MSDILPYMKTVLKGVKGIVPNDIYKDEDLDIVVINLKSGCNVTSTREEIVNHLKRTWLKNYIHKISLKQGFIEISFKQKQSVTEKLQQAINEALEVPVVKDGDLKLPINELFIRQYDVHRRYGTDWVTEYNYVSENNLTKEEFDKIIEEQNNKPYGQLEYIKKQLTYKDGKTLYRHILKAIMF